MKKLKLLSATAVLLILASACKKDYTCECTSSGGGTTKYTLIGVTKKQAKDICVSTETTDSNGNKSTNNCSLK